MRISAAIPLLSVAMLREKKVYNNPPYIVAILAKHSP
jgi:hypothetical protein